jgi:L-fucose isomerase-like protein
MEKALLFGGVPHHYLDEWEITSDFDLVKARLDIDLEVVPQEEFRSRYDGLSEKEDARACAVAEQLIGGADQTGRPRPGDDEVRKAARVYVTMRAIIGARGADAVTILCGPWEHNPVPCVPLTLLQDDGIPAACQGDIDALLTMMLFKRVTHWISFMGGAWSREGKLTVNHCVLSRKMAGPDAPMQSYYLGDYHGRHNSPTIHTDLPVGTPVTIARLTRNLEKLLLARGTVIEALDPDRGCRNTLIIDVADLPKLLSGVKGVQNHLVVAQGDHADAMARLAQNVGIEAARS